MYPDLDLKENVIHGTKDRPIHAMHFSSEEHPLFVPNHWHSYIEILFIRKGSYEFKINLEPQILKTGDLCILNSGDLHQIKNLEQHSSHDAILFKPEILIFEYPDTWNESTLRPFLHRSLISKNVIRTNDPLYPFLFPVIEQLFSIALKEQTGWYERSKLKLLEFMIVLREKNNLIPAESAQSDMDRKKIERYKKIVSYMEQHYPEPITLQDLSAIIPCHRQHLCRFFKEVSGITPIQYLIKYRIEQSCRQLLKTNHSISDIALDCGFENISYFIRKFRELKLCTPKEYRKKHIISSE